jgi:hypothetical protein
MLFNFRQTDMYRSQIMLHQKYKTPKALRGLPSLKFVECFLLSVFKIILPHKCQMSHLLF